MYFAQPRQLCNDLGADIETRAQSRVLRQVEQHRCQHGILVLQGNTTDQVRGILPFREAFRCLITRTLQRHHINRRAAHTRIIDRISVNRYQQVRLVLARDLHAFAMINIIIGMSNQDRLHARLGVDSNGE